MSDDELQAAIQRARNTPAHIVDLNKVRQMRIVNRNLAAFETLSGIPTKPITSIAEWDELEERLGVLL